VNQLKEVVRRMQRLLDQERRHLKLARQSLAAEVQQRSEVEKCFRHALADVQSELARKKHAALSETTPDDALPTELDFVPVDKLEPQDRREILRRLFAQEEVVRLIRDAAFPDPKDKAASSSSSSYAHRPSSPTLHAAASGARQARQSLSPKDHRAERADSALGSRAPPAFLVLGARKD
jgi:hypothetical protein